MQIYSWTLHKLLAEAHTNKLGDGKSHSLFLKRLDDDETLEISECGF